MEMNNASRNRSFDRSTRDPATLKKPRLITEEPTILRGNNHNNSNGGGRPLVQRQPPAGLRPAAERERDSDSLRGGGGYQPQSLSQMQHQQHQELVSQYRTALAELTFNSKPIITNLTIIAGENVHAAKAIAATICNNILEVPSDQKLPSLYLLDSIVKNIGRDYIRHFAAKLPEVFCKAYRQVDSAIHSGMRHLFGTWKGVFPPQCLQMIEKELEFQSAGNGSSGLTTSRSESQPQRPARSIHVNPKYLEARQKLQQSSRVKGTVGDMTMNLINPAEDTERSERTSVNTNSGRPRADPRLKMHNIQQAQRNAESGLAQENNTPAAGDFDYGSDRLSPSVTSFGKSSERVVEQGFDNSWYGPGSNNTETISSQRNGFDMKHGFPNHPAPRSAITDAEVQAMNTLSSKRGSEVNRSWKNSEEEEYMWDDMSARPAISGTSSSSKRDPRLHFETERLGFESHLRKPQQMHDLGPRLERDALSDLASTEHKDQPAFIQRMTSLRSQGLASTDGNSHFGSGRKLLDHAEGFSTSFSGGSAANPLPRTSLQSLTGSSHIGAHHRPLSPSLPLYQSKRALPDITEQDRSRGHLNMGLPSQSPQDSFQMMPQNSHLGNTRKPQLHSLQPPSPQLSLLHPKKHAPLQSLQPESLSEPSSQSPKLLPPQTSVAANPLVSSSELNSRPPQFPPLGSGVVAPHQSTSLPPPILHGKAEKQLLPSGAPPSLVGMAMSAPSSSSSDPVSSLLSTLVAKGFISASKADSSSSFATPAKIQSPERLKVPPIKVSSVSTSSTNDELSLPKSVVSSKGEIKSLIGFDFKPDVIRESHPAVISELTNDLPHQCAVCGLRFKLRERFDRHIEWHSLRNSESDAPSKASRRWFSSSDDWVGGKTGILSGDETTDQTEEALAIDGEQMVTADESQCVCVLCGELFNDFYVPERRKWMFKGAVYLGMSDGAMRGPIVHANCVSERSYSDLGLGNDVKVENDV